MTEDGIAEAFQEFAKKEGLPFFPEPFDAARYARLLEGLEVAEVLLSDLEFSGRLMRSTTVLAHLKAETIVSQRGGLPLGNV